MGTKTLLKTPRTLQEAIKFFADPEKAFAYAVQWRWPDGKVTCPRCKSEKHSFVNAKGGTRKLWFCYGCKKQFTLKVGTIFEDSAVPVDKWMVAIWMIVACKNGISSYELGKTIGVMQRTAWFMLQRIRKALREDFGFGPMNKIGERLQSIATCDDLYEKNERRPSSENVAWATKVLLRVVPRHYLAGAEIDTFNGEIHVSWEHKDKRVVAFLPAPNQLKLYCERTTGERIEHHLQTSNNPWEISGVLRWLFE